MRTLKKSGVTALTAGIALAIGAVPVAFVAPAIVASGETTTVTPAAGPAATAAYQPYGWLALETGTTNRTTFTRAINYPGASADDRTVVADEDLYGIEKGPDGCLLSTKAKSLDQAQTLLTFNAEAPGSSRPNVASLLDGSIGAAEKKSGTSCGRVEGPNETLTLGLNPTGLQTQTGSLVASSAYLDLELKGNAVVTATALLEGEPQGDPFILESGSSRSGDGSAFECTGGSDSGPDSGVNDNCRWPISEPSWTNAAGDANDGVYFDTLVLTAETGSFSLEGGADGLVDAAPPAGFPQTSSLIELVQPFEGTLDCEGAPATEDEPGGPEVTVYRLNNAAGDEECVLIPYSLGNALAEATFYKPLDTQVSAQFIIDLVWTIDPANTTDLEQDLLPEVSIDYESGGGEVPLRWCSGLTTYGDTEFSVVGDIEDAVENGPLDQDANLDGVQHACLISSDAANVGDPTDVVTLTQRMYLFGDARMRL